MTAIPEPVSTNEDAFISARQQFEAIVGDLMSKPMQGKTHSDIEHYLQKEGNELLRQLMQGYMSNLGEGKAVGEVCNQDGVVLSHTIHPERLLETSFGTVSLERCGYRQREASTVYPLDAQLNMPPNQYSFPLERRVVDEAIKGSFEKAVKSIQTTTGASVPKRQAEEIVVRAAADFDAFYEQGSRATEATSGPILVVTGDGKGITMIKEDLRKATRQAAEQREHKLTTRLSKGEKRNAKRMAEVVAVYTIEPHIRSADEVIGKTRPVREGEKKPPRPEYKRVWASIEKEAGHVLEEAIQEALRRDPEKSKQWVGLVDGNKSQRMALQRLAKKYDVELFIVVDFIHALEYLWRAGHALQGEGEKAEDWVLERARRLLKGQAGYVAAGVRRSATLREVTGNARKAVDKCADYLLKNAKYMKYDQCLKSGYPIATGVIEGACRYLIKDRMDITGARWGLERAEAILKLRAIESSGDLDAYWDFHEQQEHTRNHASKYLESKPPKIAQPGTPRLQVVK